MPDDSLIPISDEQAKLGQEALKVLRGLGSFLERALGDLPETLVNYLGGDWLRVRRAENLRMMLLRARERLEARGVAAPISPSLTVTLPLFRGAADESREELQEIWARLLAAAMDPSRADRVRLRFFEALQKLEPLDARVLSRLPRGAAIDQAGRNRLKKDLSISEDELDVSLWNLEKVELFSAPKQLAVSSISAFGRELLRAIAD